MTATSVIPLTHAIVIRGQHAWTRIKATAAEQRQLWRDIGEALRYGRSLHKADRAFAAWVNENGFGDIKSSTRSNAMWLAERWSVVTTNLSAELTHPDNIRSAYREAQADTPPTPELAFEAPKRLAASIEQVAPVAHKINKLASMAERGEGQEKATAQKYLDKKAKEMGMATEELVTLSKKLEPARTVPANSMDILEDTMKDALEIAVELADYIRGTQTTTGATPLSREFTLALVIKALDARGVK